jgi:hypothetical protein
MGWLVIVIGMNGSLGTKSKKKWKDEMRNHESLKRGGGR